MRPAVGKPVLLFLAALIWIGVGAMLLGLASGWLHPVGFPSEWLFVLPGVLGGLIIHHFGFLKVVDKNLARILPMDGRRCVFAFMSWKSYLIAALMVAMGTTLRHSPIPKRFLSILYIGIGLALILSSIRYLRYLVQALDRK